MKNILCAAVIFVGILGFLGVVNAGEVWGKNCYHCRVLRYDCICCDGKVVSCDTGPIWEDFVRHDSPDGLQALVCPKAQLR